MAKPDVLCSVPVNPPGPAPAKGQAFACSDMLGISSGADRSQSCTRLIGNVSIRLASKAGALSEVSTAVREGRGRIFAFCNAHTVSMAARNRKLQQAMQVATVFNDGVGIDIASQLVHGQRFIDNLNGTDLVPALLEGLQERTRVFLVGSPPGVAEIAAENLMRRYAMVDIVGVQHGFFAKTEDDDVVRVIRHSGAQLVLIGMGHPRQEIWAHDVVDRLDAVLLCIGAFLDFSANRVSRAPKLVRQLRAEWLYRLAREPRRLVKRYTTGVVTFFAIIIAQKLQRSKD